MIPKALTVLGGLLAAIASACVILEYAQAHGLLHW